MLSCSCCEESEGWVAFVAMWLTLRVVFAVMLVNLGTLKPASAGFSVLADFLGTLFAYLA